ncbi:MAG: flavodoxin domain-containing protein [Pseudomonadota bacterium]
MNIHFLYGSETGSAEILCEDIRDELNLDCTIDGLDAVKPGDLNGETFYIFISSTYGNGDLPSMAQPFADAMEADKPDLSHVQFAIFGLGDMVFAETFNNGSKQLMEMLVAAGAKMVGERGIYDASSSDMPEDVGVPWAQGIFERLRAAAA